MLTSAAACELGATEAKQQVVLADGAEGIKTQASEHFPDAGKILDWPHLWRNIRDAVRALQPGKRAARRAWRKEQYEVLLPLLWEGEREPALTYLQSLCPTTGEVPSAWKDAVLDLELTESLLLTPGTATFETLHALRGLGTSLSIDDFGTGYSSLSYLKRYPVNRVKVDRAFVTGVADRDSTDGTLVSAIIAMASALGMETIGEGIETEQQADELATMGCDIGQGFLYARPTPASDIPELLAHLTAQAQRD